MRRALAAVLPLFPASAAAETWMALTDDGSGTTSQDLLSALDTTGLLTGWDSAVWDDSATPPASALLGVDVVVLTAASGWDDPAALGDLLANHVAGGGEVVLLAGAHSGAGRPAGAWELWSPVSEREPAILTGEVDLTTTDPSHPLWTGLTDLRFPDGGQGALTLSPAGQALAFDTGGALVAAGRCDRAVLALDLWPADLGLPDPPSSPQLATWLAGAILATQENAPPLAVLDAPASVPEGGATTLLASGSDPGDLGPLTWAWDLDGDLLWEDGADAEMPWSAGTLDGPTEATVSVRVTDQCGRSSEAEATILIPNLGPTLTGLTVPGLIEEGASVGVSAAAADPGPDVLTFTWSWGDGSPLGTGDSLDHTWADDGDFVGELLIEDGDGGEITVPVDFQVHNVSPSLTDLQLPGTVVEGALATVSAAATDPGTDTLTFTWSWGNLGPDTDGETAVHTWADDGSYAVELRVEDEDGGLVVVPFTIDVDNGAPVLLELLASGPVPLGTPWSWSGSAWDPGVSDVLTWTWTWGDGSPVETGPNLDAATHTFPAPGPWLGELTVADGDGGSVSTPLTMVVWNPGPTAPVLTGPAVVPEGGTAAFAASSVDALGESLAITWTWGDGPVSDPSNPSHAWTDDGSYLVEASAADGWGAVATGELLISVQNVAPALEPYAVVPAVEGLPWVLVLAAVDPGDDPRLWSLTEAPAGAVISQGGAVSWTPAPAQAEIGSATFTVRVEDGDGGADLTVFEVSITRADSDGDGVPDWWELSQGTDALVADADLDPDGDGLSNEEEWTLGREPTMSNLPAAPVPSSPLAGERLAASAPLVVEAPTDPDMDPLTTSFELLCGTPLAPWALGDVGPTTGSVQWVPATAPPENAPCAWRARAADAWGSGPWSDWQGWYVDSLNEAPTTPAFWGPTGEVSELLPGIDLGPAGDPEGDAFVVSVRLTGPSGELDVTPAAAVPGGFRAVPTDVLADGPWLVEVQSVDSLGASGGWSASSAFVVDVQNSLPTAPEVTDPLEGERVTAPSFTLSVPDDLDDPGRVVEWSLSLDPEFHGAGREDGERPLLPGDTMAHVESSLPWRENEPLWLRARVRDGRGGRSSWAQRGVILDALAEPPGAPVVLSPGEGAALSPQALLEVSWTPVVDPEGFAVRYTVAVLDLDGNPALEEANLDPPGPVPAWSAFSALPAGSWGVRVAASDPEGLQGPWSATRSFAISTPPGQPLGLGDNGYDEVACTLGGRRTGLVGGVILLVSLRSRRRRHSS